MLDRMLDILAQHFQALASPRRLHVDLLHGRLRTDGSDLCAMYAGNGSNAEYLIGALFEGTPSRTRLAQCRPFAVASTLQRLASPAEILVCERVPLWSALGPRIGDVRVPAWIRQELRVKHSGERWVLGRHLEREVERHIRRQNYRVIMSNTTADKDTFFEEFYLPYLQSRHGAGAITASREKFSQVALRATLAKLFAGDSWAAGMLLQHQADTLRFGWFGSRNNPPAPGASEVLDVLCIRDALQRGVRCINFGNSRPSLVDGIVRYKSKFGAQVVIPRYPQTVVEFQLRSNRPALREWLTSRQFICEHADTVTVAQYPAGDPSARVQFTPIGNAAGVVQ